MDDVKLLLDDEKMLSSDIVEDDITALEIVKSNDLIHAKYKLNHFSNQVFNIALAKAETTEDGEIISFVKPTEIRQLIGLEGNSLYSRLRKSADELLNLRMVIENRTTGEFIYSNLVTDCVYKDGTFMLNFNKRYKNHLDRYLKASTSNNLYVICKFETNYSERLYEIFSTYRFIFEKYGRKEKVIEYRLSDLRMEIGTVEMNEEVHQILRSKKPKEDIIESIPKKYVKYAKWGDFRDYVLVPSMKEFETAPYSDMTFSFEPIKKNNANNGKIVGVRFTLKPKRKVKRKVMTTEEKFIDKYLDNTDIKLCQDLIDLLPEHNISMKDAISIVQIAKNDREEVMQAVAYVKRKNIKESVVGYIITTLREGWAKDPKKEPKQISITDYEKEIEYSKISPEILKEYGLEIDDEEAEKEETVDESLEAAKKHEKICADILKQFAIQGRTLAPAELMYVTKWEVEYQASEELINEACRRTMEITHQGSFAYADAVLKNWKDNNVKTMDEVLLNDEEVKKARKKSCSKEKPATSKKRTSKKKANAFNNYNGRNYSEQEMNDLARKLIKTDSPKSE